MRRRTFLQSAAVLAARPGGYRLAVFRADITPPLGGPLFNDVPARRVADPLYAHGLVLLGEAAPLVIAALDWCEIRNEAYTQWRAALAAAARTSTERVLLSCVHQHDAPYIDTGAERLLREAGGPGRICDPAFNERAALAVAAALRRSLPGAQPVTHYGTGQARVEGVASNRRYVRPDGTVSFGRTSATRDPAIRAMPEGVIDPWLKTLSFWDGGRPLAAVSCYATHPMSYYGQGEVSADFVGAARARRQRDLPDLAQIYLSGCSGDTMAGKYNDGDPANRPVLAGRLYDGLRRAWQDTTRHPLREARFRTVPLALEPRRSPGFSREEMRRTLADLSLPYRPRASAALGLSWLDRIAAGRAIDVPCIDFGAAQFVLLPAETFVQYQLRAQKMRPDSFVMATAFGECAPGYIPTAQAAAEGYDDDYSWIAFPECEPAMLRALQKALAA